MAQHNSYGNSNKDLTFLVAAATKLLRNDRKLQDKDSMIQKPSDLPDRLTVL